MAIKLQFGDGTDATTVENVFGHLRGYVLEVDGKDIELIDIRHTEDGSLAFYVAPWSDETDEADRRKAYHVDFWDMKSLVIY